MLVYFICSYIYNDISTCIDKRFSFFDIFEDFRVNERNVGIILLVKAFTTTYVTNVIIQYDFYCINL